MPVIRLGQGALTGTVMLVVFAATSFAQVSSPDPRYSPHEVIVVGRPPGQAGGGLSGVAPFALRDLAASAGVTTLSARRLVEGRAGAEAFPGGAWVLTLADGEDPAIAAAKIGEDPAVAYAGPNHLIPIEEPELEPLRAPFVSPAADSTNDPLFEDQFGMPLARIPEVWGVTQGEGMLIAIIDTGVKLDHPDLVGQIAVNAVEAAGLPGVDDDKNGFVDDIMGYDFADAPDLPGVGDSIGRDPDPSDDVGHGTRVAGVACATRNNGIGIAGVAPKAKILAIRAGFRTGLPFLSAVLQEDDAAAGIIYAADRGAQILNLSFGSTSDAPLIRTAVQYARDRGALVVVSAGNTRIDEAYYPAGYPGMLVVGASDQEDQRTAFSTFGQDLDLLALGISVLSTDLDGGYRFSAGTSFSSPMVAGIAALLWSVTPDWSADQIAWQMRLSSRRSGGGWNPQQGWGLVDAVSALAFTTPPPLVQVEAARVENAILEIDGTVADPDLSRWSLTALTEESAVNGDLDEEIVLVEHSTLQVVRNRLATFVPPPGSSDWVLRLVAGVSSMPEFEERSRHSMPPPVVEITGLNLELQAGNDGWDIAASWSSLDVHQGAVRLSGPGIDTRVELEPSRGNTHGIRIPGPIPPGTWSVEILARAGSHQPFQVLASVPIDVPIRQIKVSAVLGDPQPPGTPMPKAVNWDGDAFPEILVEEPPSVDLYGSIIHYEILANGDAVMIDDSGDLVAGIPMDAADANGNGHQELLVFRLDEWSIRESQGNGFLNRFLHSESPGESLPLGFLVTEGETRFLAVAGSSLRLYRSDDPGGYTRITDATAGESNLLNRFAVGNFDGTGVPEVVVVNEVGELIVFEVTPQTVTWKETLTPPKPLAASLLAVSAFGGRDDLITVEQDPPSPQEDGDLQRAAARVRRWQHDGVSLKPVASVAFAGVHLSSDFQFTHTGENVFLRRGTVVDVLSVTGNGLTWGGRVHSSALERVDGIALVGIGAPSPQMLWIGNSAKGTSGERVHLSSALISDVASRLEVMAAAAIPDGVAVTLGWEPDPCAPLDSVLRNGTIRGSYTLPVVMRSAVDTVSLGEDVAFRLPSAACPERTLMLTGKTPGPLMPSWDNGRIVLRIDPPLRHTSSGSIVSPRDVQLVYDGIPERPVAVHVLGEGTGLLIEPASPGPDSLVVTGAWHRDGYPVGGRYRAAAGVPVTPPMLAPPVIAEVEYRGSESAIEVVMSGQRPPCDYQYRIEALDLTWSIPSGAPSWPTFNLSLGMALDPGTYTLEMSGDCLGDPSGTPGQSRSFRVGFLAYPNPIRSGDELVLENLEPGSRIQLLDVSGREQASWTVNASPERRSLDIAPGLYFMRVESPAGALLGLQKLGVLR